jgi:hypothetical protein
MLCFFVNLTSAFIFRNSQKITGRSGFGKFAATSSSSRESALTSFAVFVGTQNLDLFACGNPPVILLLAVRFAEAIGQMRRYSIAVDTPRSEDAGILKDKLWGMNPPKV